MPASPIPERVQPRLDAFAGGQRAAAVAPAECERDRHVVGAGRAGGVGAVGPSMAPGRRASTCGSVRRRARALRSRGRGSPAPRRRRPRAGRRTRARARRRPPRTTVRRWPWRRRCSCRSSIPFGLAGEGRLSVEGSAAVEVGMLGGVRVGVVGGGSSSPSDCRVGRRVRDVDADGEQGRSRSSICSNWVTSMPTAASSRSSSSSSGLRRATRSTVRRITRRGSSSSSDTPSSATSASRIGSATAGSISFDTTLPPIGIWTAGVSTTSSDDVRLEVGLGVGVAVHRDLPAAVLARPTGRTRWVTSLPVSSLGRERTSPTSTVSVGTGR